MKLSMTPKMAQIFQLNSFYYCDDGETPEHILLRPSFSRSLYTGYIAYIYVGEFFCKA